MGAEDPGERFLRIREALPPQIKLIVAAKGRRTEEVARLIEAGAVAVGHNYVQEAERMQAELGALADSVEWHMIGHLQRNKARLALALFEVIQTLDSPRLARAIDRRAEEPVPVLIEVNVAGEESKYGVPPQGVRALLEAVAGMELVQVEGLMTMEPYLEDAERARPYFRRMRELLEELKGFEAPNVRMRELSMGMTHSYAVAAEEGATMVRIGTAIFGPR